MPRGKPPPEIDKWCKFCKQFKLGYCFKLKRGVDPFNWCEEGEW